MSSITSGKHILLIESDVDRAEQIRVLLENTGVVLYTVSTIQRAVSQMMISTFDVVALDAGVEDAAQLIRLLLDLRHAKNTRLILYPI